MLFLYQSEFLEVWIRLKLGFAGKGKQAGCSFPVDWICLQYTACKPSPVTETLCQVEGEEDEDDVQTEEWDADG